MTPPLAASGRPIALAGAFAVMSVAGGQWLGGGWALERSDLALAVPTLLVFALVYGKLSALMGVPARQVIGLGAGAAGVAALVSMATASTPWADALTFLAATIAALLVAAGLRRLLNGRPLWLALPALALAAGLWWLSGHVGLARLYAPSPQAASGRTILLTGLPLRQWARAGQADYADDPALTALGQQLARPVVVQDALAANGLAPSDRLLLAHPLALSPATLVEVDRFVRRGGRAVILADGLSGWPPPYRFGDPRNPPVTSLLTPLLDHWGLTLAAPAPDGPAAGAVSVRDGGQRLAFHSPGYFAAVPGSCRTSAIVAGQGASVATCRIGAGTAVLLADADLLYAPLWQPQPAWAAHLRPADNIAWVAAQLNGPDAGPAWGLRPTWR